MAFLSSLQEATQSHTGGVLFFRAGQDKSSEVGLGLDLPKVTRDYLEFGHFWGRNNALGYMLESVTGETKAASSTILYEPLPSKSSLSEVIWKTWSGFRLTSPGFLEKQQIGRGVSTLITWQSHSKVWKDHYRLVLDLQDLFVMGQVWDENDLISASYLSTNAQSLEQVYDFRKPIEVSHFLAMNPFLIPLLGEAYTHIKKFFPSSKLFVEVVADPEEIDEQQLVVFIAANHDPDEASEALDQFDKDWWLDAMDRAQDKLCITLEFQ